MQSAVNQLAPLTDQELWQLDTQGFVRVRDVLNSQELATLALSNADLSSLSEHPILMRYANLLCASIETSAGRLNADTSARVDRGRRPGARPFRAL